MVDHQSWVPFDIYLTALLGHFRAQILQESAILGVFRDFGDGEELENLASLVFLRFTGHFSFQRRSDSHYDLEVVLLGLCRGD